MVNWNFLETFIILSENLSFSLTAQKLNTAQPVISRQIRMLEENLGYILFIRSKKKVVLSNEGQALKLKLGPLVDEIKKIISERELLNQKNQLLKGVIRVGSMPEAGQNILMPKINDFLEIHPDLNIHTTFISSATVNELVLNGNLDFGFVYTVADRKSLKSFPVYQDQAVLITEKRKSKNWHLDKAYQFISYREKDLYQKEFIEKFFSKSDQKKIKFGSSVNSHSSMIEMVCKQKCLAVLPKSSVTYNQLSNQIQIIAEDKKIQKLSLICHEQILIDQKKKLFLEYLLERFNYSV